MLARTENSHIWQRQADDHYVEQLWCNTRLFQVEKFEGTIQDPFCGFGRVVEAGKAAGLPIFGTDIVDRGYPEMREVADFQFQTVRVANIVANPPFKVFEEVARRALDLTSGKVALIWLTRRLAAAHWLRDLPLARIHFLTPRPSMPPGHVIAADQKVGGGKQDFCWLVFDHAHAGPATAQWLHRDEVPA